MIARPFAGLTVSQLNHYIKDLLDRDDVLRDVWVEGEVSNLTRSSAGHVYFSLKDAECAIRCVMWRSIAARLDHLPAHGESVLLRGYVSVYAVQGNYQLYIEDMRPLGLGLLNQRFEALKRKLAAEGLFDEGRKRRLPAFPRSIGVVTSPTGAAFQDIKRVLKERFPMARVVLSPTLVQGDGAPAQIVRALQLLNRHRGQYDLDVIIIARGGGSLEDLWAFNDERVARAVAASEVPVISGVGHETDFTIVDFVADWRSPTPTGAAAAAVPDQVQLMQQVDDLEAVLGGLMTERLSAERDTLERLALDLMRAAPRSRLVQGRQRLDDLTYRSRLLMQHRLTTLRNEMASRTAQLQALDPGAVLRRGYAIVRRHDDGKLVSSVEHVGAGTTLDVQVKDGTFGAITY